MSGKPQRLIALLAVLQVRRVTTAEALAAEFGVSVRTILRDIQALIDADIPVLTERGKYGGISLLSFFGLICMVTGRVVLHPRRLRLTARPSSRPRPIPCSRPRPSPTPVAIPAAWCKKSRRLEGDSLAPSRRSKRRRTISPRPSTVPSIAFPCWASGGVNEPGASRGVSSKCWRWRGRSLSPRS